MNADAMYDVVQTQSEGVRGRGCGCGHCGEGTETDCLVDREHPIFISHNMHSVHSAYSIVPQMVRRTTI